MRTIVLISLAALSLAACKPAEPAMKDHEMPTAPAVKSGSGKGVVKAVDLKAHTVTLDHEPIPAVGWPAMTMTFPVASPELLNGIAAGQTVTFEVTVTDNKPVITALKR